MAVADELARPHIGCECACTLRPHLAVIALLACISGFYVATIRQGNTWGDDFALYIRHAQNIAAGRPYSDTGYIYNPAVPIYGPPTYPPIFPLLLAPVYHFAGLNFWAMKCEQVAFFVLALLVIYVYLLRFTSPVNATIVIGLLGFNPNFWARRTTFSPICRSCSFSGWRRGSRPDRREARTRLSYWELLSILQSEQESSASRSLPDFCSTKCSLDGNLLRLLSFPQPSASHCWRRKAESWRSGRAVPSICFTRQSSP
jgi:hypothetical protein